MSRQAISDHRHLLIIGGLAVLLVLGTALLYGERFGFAFSLDHARWAEFGDYFGGTVGPLLNLLALVAILLTLVQQARQLDISSQELEQTRLELRKTAQAAELQAAHFQRSERRTDLYRLIEALAMRVNRNFNENRLDGDLSLHWLVSHFGDPDAKSAIDGIAVAFHRESTKSHRLISWFQSDLRRLAHYIKQYEEVSDTSIVSTPLPDFYKKEFGSAVRCLHEMRCMDDELFEFYCQ
jgi:hypothetical protein